MPQTTSAHSGGFSLLELVAVLVVASILVAAVVLRMEALTQHAATTRADELRRNLAHVQQLALGWGDSLRLTVAANSYTITCLTTVAPSCAAIGVGVGGVPKDPATGENFSVTLADGVTLVEALNRNTVDFDSLGRPTSGGVLIATNPARTYTLTGGTRTAQVSLLPITGFAETSY
jgi:MSHA pilin protein MshC